MASIRKHGEKWQARIQRRGQPSLAKSFSNKADALKWARNTESQLDLGTFAPKQAMPRLKLMVERYVNEVTPMKKGSLQERGRASLIKRTKLAEMYMDRIDGTVIAKYRDQRLTEVSNNTVRLELAFLSVVFEQCRREWGIPVANPVKQVRMPKPRPGSSASRSRTRSPMGRWSSSPCRGRRSCRRSVTWRVPSSALPRRIRSRPRGCFM